MTARGAARRYAAVLFDVVRQDGDPARTEAALAEVAALVNGHEQLRRVLQTPAIPVPKKRAVLEAVLRAAGGVVPEVERFLLLLADHGQLRLLDEVAQAFAARRMDESGVLPAEVVTAVPLDDARRTALAGALRRATGSRVTLTERVDPSIVGGVVARVGSVVFDGSVTRHIERLRQRLLADA